MKRINEDMDRKQKQHPIVDVIGDRSKVQCCKEQYCRGTWNIMSMNQGKLEVVKQIMARVNINILEISELKWTEMGEFNSGDHYVYYCGQVLGCNLKNDRMISKHFQGEDSISQKSKSML